jgi:nucleotide-binding universal stress UspA family protein
MKKKILIPTDFSKNAWNAVTYASDLFKDQECTFYILNAFTTSGYSLGDMMVPEPGSASYDNAQISSENSLEKVMDMLKFREQNDKHTYTTIAQFNSPLEAMKSIIEKRDIDLVVMGTKGASNDSGASFGSNTITAMEKIRSCPIMGIPLTARVAHLKEIVFPTSYKTHFKRRELQYLVDLAQLQDANICIVHVDEHDDHDNLSKDQKENKQLLEECLEGANYTFHNIGGSDTTESVQRFVESRDSDMIAFINKKHAFFGSIFSTPMVKELGMFSDVPLLALHDWRN